MNGRCAARFNDRLEKTVFGMKLNTLGVECSRYMAGENNVFRSTHLNLSLGHHEPDGVCHAKGEFEVVGGDDDGEMFIASQGAQQTHQFDARSDVKEGRRF